MFNGFWAWSSKNDRPGGEPTVPAQLPIGAICVNGDYRQPLELTVARPDSIDEMRAAVVAGLDVSPAGAPAYAFRPLNDTTVLWFHVDTPASGVVMGYEGGRFISLPADFDSFDLIPLKASASKPATPPPPPPAQASPPRSRECSPLDDKDSREAPDTFPVQRSAHVDIAAPAQSTKRGRRKRAIRTDFMDDIRSPAETRRSRRKTVFLDL